LIGKLDFQRDEMELIKTNQKIKAIKQ